MLVTALVLALQAAPPVEQWTIDAPLIVTASAPSSNVETALLPWLSIRAAHMFPFGASDKPDGVVDARAAWGFDVTLMGSWSRDGTNEVAATRGLTAFQGRGLISPGRLTSEYSSLVPYGYAGLLGGGGFVDIRAFKDEHTDPLGTWGASLGLGARAAIHSVTTTLELGAGMRDLRFELSSSLALGFTF